MASRDHQYDPSLESDSVWRATRGHLHASRPAVSLLAEVLDTIDDAYCVCDRSGRIQHENHAFRQIITKCTDIEPIRAEARALARRTEGFSRGVPPGMEGGQWIPAHSSEFTHAGYKFRMRASALRATPSDPSAATLISLETQGTAGVPEHLRTAYRLTPRETEVVELLAEGHSNKSVAQILGVSAHTARHHTARVLAKLGASGRAEVGALIRRLRLN